MSIKLHQQSPRGRTNMTKQVKPETGRNMIFVFGSNTAGIHGGGAARFALLKYGAVMGVGEGPTGRSYALPTKGQKTITTRVPAADGKYSGPIIGDTLPLVAIQDAVNRFLEYARQNPGQDFQVTRVGCGLAGLKDEWIAPMFTSVPNNCYFDTEWLKHLPERDEPYRFWGSF